MKKRNLLLRGINEGGYGGKLFEQLGEENRVYVLGRKPQDKDFQEYVQDNGGIVVPYSGEVFPQDLELTKSHYQKTGRFLNQELSGESLDGVVQFQAGIDRNITSQELKELFIPYRNLEIPFENLPQKMIQGSIEIYASSHIKLLETLKNFDVLDENTRCISTSFDEEMPGYPHELKRILEYRLHQIAQTEGLNTLSLALPKANTPSTKEFQRLLDPFILKEFLQNTSNSRSQNEIIQIFQKIGRSFQGERGNMKNSIDGIHAEINLLGHEKGINVEKEIRDFLLPQSTYPYSRDDIDGLNPQFVEGFQELLKTLKPVRKDITEVTENISLLVKRSVAKTIKEKITSKRPDWEKGDKQRIKYENVFDAQKNGKYESVELTPEEPPLVA